MLDVYVFTVNRLLLWGGRQFNCANVYIGTTDYQVSVRIVQGKAGLTVSDSIHTLPYSIQKQKLEMSRLVNIFNYGAHCDLLETVGSPPNPCKMKYMTLV
jgi:hypothetical protein